MALRHHGGGKGGEASLADHQASLNLALANPPALIVIHGPNDFLRLEASRLFQAAWSEKHPGGEIAMLRAAGESSPLSYADVTLELSGGSLFAGEKLVMIRQAERLLFPAAGGKGGTEEGGGETPVPGREKRFVEFLDNPSRNVWLALETSQLPKNRTMGKKIAAACHLIPCPDLNAGEAARWLKERAAGLGQPLASEAAELLLMAHGPDLGVLAGELDKLVLYVGNGKEVDAAAAGEFLTGTIEFDIFGFTNAIEERNPAKALDFARKIAVIGSRDQKGKKDDGERSAHRALAMLAGTVQNLLRAGVARYERRGAADFAASEKQTPWRAERLMAAAGRYSLRELRGMAGLAAEHIKRSHDTGGDARLALELLAVRLTLGKE